MLREATLHAADRAGAVRLGAGPHRHPAAAGRGDLLSAQPGRHAAGRRRQPQEAATPRNVRKPSPDEPFCGLVFKIDADKHGDLHYVRVYSGALKANSRVLNPGKDKKENVPQLWHIQADRREQVPSVAAGDIVGIIGLRHSVTGDTLCDPQHPILLETIQFPETVISMAIEPETLDRAQEAGRRAGDDEAAGSHVPRPAKTKRPARR